MIKLIVEKRTKKLDTIIQSVANSIKNIPATIELKLKPKDDLEFSKSDYEAIKKLINPKGNLCIIDDNEIQNFKVRGFSGLEVVIAIMNTIISKGKLLKKIDSEIHNRRSEIYELPFGRVYICQHFRYGAVLFDSNFRDKFAEAIINDEEFYNCMLDELDLDRRDTHSVNSTMKLFYNLVSELYPDDSEEEKTELAKKMLNKCQKYIYNGYPLISANHAILSGGQSGKLTSYSYNDNDLKSFLSFVSKNKGNIDFEKFKENI